MSDQQFKVTDKRIFTPDGKLKEEYRFLEEAAETAAADPEGGSSDDPPSDIGPGGDAPDAAATRFPPGLPGPSQAPLSEGVPPAGGTASGARPGDAASGPPLEIPQTGPGPSFMDLVAMMAEPIPIFLGDVPQPDGSTYEDLELARMHIDLLDVLRRKTAGNLSARESAMLEDVLYQLRMRYVQKKG